MKPVIPLIMVFITLNVAIFVSGLAKLESDVGSALFSGYHAHFAAFFCLSLVLSLILMHKSVNVSEPLMISFIYSLFIAILLEVMQMQVGRDFSIFDMLASGIGAGSFWLIGYFFDGLFKKYWINL